MGRLDHSMINVLIAGTFTPFGMLALSGTLGAVLLAIIWGGAIANILLHVAWIDAPKWLSAATYVLLGWVGVAAMPGLVLHGDGRRLRCSPPAASCTRSGRSSTPRSARTPCPRCSATTRCSTRS